MSKTTASFKAVALVEVSGACTTFPEHAFCDENYYLRLFNVRLLLYFETNWIY